MGVVFQDISGSGKNLEPFLINNFRALYNNHKIKVMSELSTFIANCAYQIASLRRRRDLVKGEMALMEFLEEKKTRQYKVLYKELRELETSLIQLVLDYQLAKDLENTF